jgi:NAD(P) transhydrogenase subunit alpha
VLVTAGSTSAIAVTVGLIAIVLATVNLVGGFVVTDRMLEMFKGRQKPSSSGSAGSAGSAGEGR